MKQKTKELGGWEKEFDSKFLIRTSFTEIPILYDTKFTGVKEIKDFIQSLLTQQRTELLEEIKDKFPDIDNSKQRWISKQLYDAKNIHKFLQSLKEEKI